MFRNQAAVTMLLRVNRQTWGLSGGYLALSPGWRDRQA